MCTHSSHTLCADTLLVVHGGDQWFLLLVVSKVEIRDIAPGLLLQVPKKTIFLLQGVSKRK